jgi:ribulose-5-phosphate 4-epimerase/fuculose-1-phosphate aldolase
MIDEGVVKFDCDHTPGPAVEAPLLDALDAWRSRLFDAGLIGEYAEHGIGYGNVSARLDDGTVIVTGSQTGARPRLGRAGYARVLASDLARNHVRSEGPVPPSSETLTHMALYAAIAECRAVFHVHDADAWRTLRGRLPTTGEDVPYGTPAMALELERLYRETDFATGRLAVMGGHEDGLIAFGRSLDEAGDTLMHALRGA